MGERKNLAILEWLEGSCEGTRNHVNKKHITPSQFEVGDTVVAKIGSKKYKGKVIELPQSVVEKQGLKRARKAKAAPSKQNKAKPKRRTKPKRDISDFQFITGEAAEAEDAEATESEDSDSESGDSEPEAATNSQPSDIASEAEAIRMTPATQPSAETAITSEAVGVSQPSTEEINASQRCVTSEAVGASQPSIQTTTSPDSQPKMPTTQLMEDAMTESFLHSVLGDIEDYSSNPCEWNFKTTNLIADQVKLDQILLQQRTMISLLQNLQEGQKSIELRIEQLETIAHFTTPPLYVRSSHSPKPVTLSVNRQPPVTPSINQQPPVTPPVHRQQSVTPPICRQLSVTPPVNRQPLQPVNCNQLDRANQTNDVAEKLDVVLPNDEDIDENYEIPQSVLAEANKMSIHRANFASHLVRRVFSEDVLKNSNVRGKRGKKMLNTIKMDAVKDAVFKYYPLGPEETARVSWDRCVTAVDAYNRTRFGK